MACLLQIAAIPSTKWLLYEGASWSYDTPSISNQNRFPGINHHQLLVVFIIVSDDMNIPISIISRALGHNSEATTQDSDVAAYA